MDQEDMGLYALKEMKVDEVMRLKAALEDVHFLRAELAELRDAVVRYFTYKDRSEKLWIKQRQTNLSTNESYFTAKKKAEAEQELRGLIERTP